VVTHISSIAHDLVFNLFPPLQTLFNQHLRAQRQTLGREVAQLFLVVCETGTETAERKGGTEDDGVANLGGGVERGLDGGDGGGLGRGDFDF
jgi:hypothetical protein